MQILNASGLRGFYGVNTASKFKYLQHLSEAELLAMMGSTELAANLFRATQAEDKLKREQTKGKIRANQLHYDVGKRVRQTIQELGGTMPEKLAPAENIEKVAKRLKKTAVAGLSPANNDLESS